MKVREGLVLKKDGSVIGFVDMGDINNSIQELQAKLGRSDSEEIVADHIMTVMVQGILICEYAFSISKFSNKRLCFVCHSLFMYLSCIDLKGTDLHNILWVLGCCLPLTGS